jgi:hypothetical protein
VAVVNWINPETGMLHRRDCPNARHLMDGETKGLFTIGRTLDGRPVNERLPQPKRGMPEGVGVAWLSKCKVCTPETD